MTTWDEEVEIQKQRLLAHPTGHTWQLEEDGRLDLFVLDYGHHNGPGCVKCGYSYCHWCQNEPTQVCPCKGQIEIPTLEDSGVRVDG